MKKRILLITLVSAPLILTGCINIKTHSTIDPIYMTLDVNLKVQLQQELSDVFGDIDAASKSVSE